MQLVATRWGNSLGVRLPKAIAAEAGLREGSRVEMRAENGQIVVAPARPRPTLDELLVGMTPEAMHEAFDWGEAVGRERVDRPSRGSTLAS